MNPVERLRAELKNVKDKSGGGFTASCPVTGHEHNDKERSLSVDHGDDGRALVKCFTGHTFDQVLAALDMKPVELFPSREELPPLTIADLARDKCLPDRFLRSLGLKEWAKGVIIPYKLENGQQAPRQRCRFASKATDGSKWTNGEGAIVPYGLDRLPAAREVGWLITGEGESDGWTAWRHGFHYLGIPGADMAGKLQAEHLADINRLYLIREPGKGGATFTKGMAARLRAIGWQGEAFVIVMDDQIKDLNGLHRHGPGTFKERLQEMLNQAQPLAEYLKATATSSRPEQLDPEEEKTISAAQRLIAIGETAELFHDERGDGYAAVPGPKGRLVLRIRGRDFRRYLAATFYQQTGKGANGEAVAAALSALDGKALFSGERVPLHNRYAAAKGELWIDMADPQWRAVRVTPAGWDVLARPPILFRRFSHQAPMPEPARDGDARELLRFLNLARPADEVLLLAWLVAVMIGDIPRPAICFHGAQGSAKSTTARMARRLVDPSCADTVELHHNRGEMAQVFDQHAVPLFDNLSGLQGRQGDMLCTAITGGGFAKRELYSDSDSVLMSFKRALLITGINVPTAAPDLLDRLILIELERVPREKRREESVIWCDFDAAHPRILGGLLDALAGAMRIYPTLDLPELPRMADFARWGAAAAEALGYGAQTFLDAYFGNVEHQLEEVLESSPVAQAVRSLAEDRGTWTGTAKELHDLLAEREPQNAKGEGWPKQPNQLTRRLRILQTTLADVGIGLTIARARRGATITINQTVRVEKSSSHTVTPSPTSNGAGSAGDGAVTTIVTAPETSSPGDGDRAAGDGAVTVQFCPSSPLKPNHRANGDGVTIGDDEIRTLTGAGSREVIEL